MQDGYSAGDCLDFTLPPFLRLSWASDHARYVWSPRLKQVVTAWKMIEWESVLCGIRKCALERASRRRGPCLADLRESALRKSLFIVELDGEPAAAVQGPGTDQTFSPGEYSHFLIGDRCSVDEFQSAWSHADHDKIGQALGYPRCCVDSFSRRYASGDTHDPIWPTSWAQRSRTLSGERQVAIEAGEPPCNLLWRPVGVRAIPHLPCSFLCDASVKMYKQFMDLGLRLGYAHEMAWLRQILSWPAEWSALHGIAEIKTPICKIVVNTDATAHKFTVRWPGSGYPPEGTRGVRFPYQTPSRLVVTESPAYQRGLANNSRSS